MRETFEKTIKAYVSPHDRLALAVSGGKDSMCLLSLFLTSPNIKKENLSVLSIDHKIRGEKSARDVEFVCDFCFAHGVRFSPFAVDVPALAKKFGVSVETAARNARREIFYSLVDGGAADMAVTAHHASDNAESLLMHVFRGCGLKGLCGMGYREGFLFRPLIEVKREEIDAYVRETAVPYVTDGTNADNAYARNFIRNEVLPRIKEKYPGAEDALLRLSGEARDALNIIEGQIDPSVFVYADGPSAVKIPISALENPAPAPYYVSEAIERRFNALNGLERAHINSVAALVFAKNGSGVDLPQNLRAVREYEYITIYRKENKKSRAAEIPFKTGQTIFDGVSIEVGGDPSGAPKDPSGAPQMKKNLYFDLKKIPASAVFRYRRDGDVFKPYGGGTKKLKEYLIDKKIPARFRNRLLCLADGSEILAVLGVEISDKIKVDKDSGAYSIAVFSD